LRRETLLVKSKPIDQMAMTDELKIEFRLKYPLHLRRFRGEERVVMVDSASIPVAHFVNYQHAFEIVRLANACYTLLKDLSNEPVPGKEPRNLAVGAQDPD
jgi:hypothetical protein